MEPASTQSAPRQSERPQQDSNSTAKVKDYLARASKNKATRMKRNSHRQDEVEPLLKKGKTNRILVYPGAFNPPHRGHMRALQHAFHECGPEFNAVAAIVLLAPDTYLSYKNETSSRNLLLNLSQRRQLWMSDEESPDWAWIMEKDDWWPRGIASGEPPRVDVYKRMIQLAKDDGFVIECVTLGGPDNYESQRAESSRTICTRLLVSTAARAPAPGEYSDANGPIKATNYNEWQDHTVKAQQGRSQSDDARRPSWLSGAPQTRVWFCDSRKNTRAWIAYLYLAPPPAGSQKEESVSSTSIHNAIATLDDKDLFPYLGNFALSPATLMGMLGRTGSTPL